MNKLQHLKIVVAEDEPFLREILKDLLELEGAEVFEAENGMVAFDLAKKEQIDVIISDLRMPGGGGIALMENLRKAFDSPPLVFFCSGFADTPIDDVKSMGASGLLQKPFTIETIITEITNALSKRRNIQT